MKGKIKIGAQIMQDYHFGKWPECCPPKSEYEGKKYQFVAKNPDMIFDVEWNGKFWDCKADGYGYLRSKGENGDYGNGCIFVTGIDSVQVIEQ